MNKKISRLQLLNEFESAPNSALFNQQTLAAVLGGEWGRLLEGQDDDGIIHQWAMPLALLQGDASEVRRELASLGLSISPKKLSRDLLATYLRVFPVEIRASCVDRLGWHENLFVTASQIIGHYWGLCSLSTCIMFWVACFTPFGP